MEKKENNFLQVIEGLEDIKKELLEEISVLQERITTESNIQSNIQGKFTFLNYLIIFIY